jgi:hypothetical protein
MIPGGVGIPHVNDGPSEARVWGSGGGVGIEARRSAGREAQVNHEQSNDVPACGWRGGNCQPCLPSVSVSRSRVSARGCRARRCCMGDRAAVSRMARLAFDPVNQAAGVPRVRALETCDSPRNDHA